MDVSEEAFDRNWNRRKETVLALVEAEELMMKYTEEDPANLLGTCKFRVVEYHYDLYRLNKEYDDMIHYSVEQRMQMPKKTIWNKLFRK